MSYIQESQAAAALGGHRLCRPCSDQASLARRLVKHFEIMSLQRQTAMVSMCFVL